MPACRPGRILGFALLLVCLSFGTPTGPAIAIGKEPPPFDLLGEEFQRNVLPLLK